MSYNSQLLYAILSMDTYHHGAVGGIDLRDRKSIEIDDTIRASEGSSIDAIGFSAQLYTLGTTDIIAYRGTDDGGANLGDIAGGATGVGGTLYI
jgi:hypothetical protein